MPSLRRHDRRQAPISTKQQSEYNVLAIVGFIASFFVSIAGLICSVIARRQINESGEKGMGLATAGMVISIVSIALSVVAIIIYIALIGSILGAVL